MALISRLTEENTLICKRIYGLDILTFIPSYIRSYDDNIKILSINIMINVLSNSCSNYYNQPLVIWSISILLNLIKEENSISLGLKIKCLTNLTLITEKSLETQTIFFNIDGVETLLAKLRALYSEEKLKEIDEFAKNLKSNKSKKGEKFFSHDDNNISLQNIEKNIIDENLEYKRCILDCLASVSSSKEETRKKIIESKEFNIILYSLDETNPKILLSSASLILSLSRAHMILKKFLHDYDITSILFKLTNHSNIEIQISITSSLCNFLLDYTTNMNEIIECVSKLHKILTATKNNNIRYNTICSIKNILYHICSMTSNSNYKDIKKNIMKKLTYDFLLNLLDDPEIRIQEQALIIFRSLLFKSPEDIDEVFNACKNKLLKKIEEKLNSENTCLILQTLYVLMNISLGNEKHKAPIFDKFLLKKISILLENSENEFKKLCITILNNLLLLNIDKNAELTFEKKIILINEFDIISKLEKIIEDDDEESDTINIAKNIIQEIKKLNN
jgi:hypothetical protein